MSQSKPDKNNIDENVRPRHLQLSDDPNIISINVSIFSLFTVLVFSYFVFFELQLTEVKADISAKIIEINAINIPHSAFSISFGGNNEYYYVKRKEILLNDFRNINRDLQESNLSKQETAEHGKKIQLIMSNIAYSYPFKRMIYYSKDGNTILDLNHNESIDTVEEFKSDKPIYPRNINSNREYSMDAIKVQIDEIRNYHQRFTLEFKDGKEKIIDAILLANNLKGEYNKTKCSKYVNGLIEYLEDHYRLAIPLGLTIKKYDYYIQKANMTLIISLSCLLALNFILGIIIPLFFIKLRNNKILWATSELTFVIGLIILFSASLFSIPL